MNGTTTSIPGREPRKNWCSSLLQAVFILGVLSGLPCSADETREQARDRIQAGIGNFTWTTTGKDPVQLECDWRAKTFCIRTPVEGNDESRAWYAGRIEYFNGSIVEGQVTHMGVLRKGQKGISPISPTKQILLIVEPFQKRFPERITLSYKSRDQIVCGTWKDERKIFRRSPSPEEMKILMTVAPIAREAERALKENRPERARELISSAIEYRPEQSEFFLFRAYCRERQGKLDDAIADCTAALRFDPDADAYIDAHYYRGALYHKLHDFRRAKADLSEAYRWKRSAALANSLAWLYATAPDASVRAGKLAVLYATQACKLTEWEDPIYLDTLAAAYAEDGDFDKAVEWQTKVLALPESFPKGELAKCQERLRLYQQKQPYREN